MGFEINPYDKCVANNMINGKQCTIGWYVDDNNIYHVETKVVYELLDVFKDKFGDLTITRGNTHDFLGMDITVTNDKRLDICMKKKKRSHRNVL